MADQYPSLNEELRTWIGAQHLFFVATAAADGRINLSPKGQDHLHVVDDHTVLWLNLTGSGNETAAHLRQVNRITMMWCAFEGPPRILRIYGTARIIHERDDDWQRCVALIPPPLGARQYFEVHIDMVQTSCGYAVPLMDFVEDRTALTKWTEKRGPQGIAAYWRDKNLTSLDGLPTGLLEDA